MADDDDFYTFSSSDIDLDDDADQDVYVESDGEQTGSFERSIVSVITKESIVTAQREDLQKVMDFLALKEQNARTLLIYYRWEVERVFEMLERKGRELMLKEAGVTIAEEIMELCSSGPMTCGICFADVDRDAISVMDCGHWFCNDCWTGYFIAVIREGQSRRIRCMAVLDTKCSSICDEAIVRGLVSRRDPNIAERFERFLLESYIDDNDKVKWCPSVPHCGNALRVEEDSHCEVECTCGHQFCFSCLMEAHSPCSCMMWDLWSKKCNIESENVGWITLHTKPCPKCHRAVEKNGGCNLVYCICGQAFCWLCGDATGLSHTWESIAGHSCNRLKDNELKESLAKKNKYRFVHYFNRYKAHTDSLTQENNMKVALQEKIKALEGKQRTFKDYSWAVNAMSRLFRSRRILSYSYPFAFYMFWGELFKRELSDRERQMKQNLFEDQQQQLESNVERLSMYLEKNFESFTDDEIYNTKIRVLDLTRIVEFICREMYKCIENELLEPTATANHHIAPYKPIGPERAQELTVCSGSNKRCRQ